MTVSYNSQTELVFVPDLDEQERPSLSVRQNFSGEIYMHLAANNNEIQLSRYLSQEYAVEVLEAYANMFKQAARAVKKLKG